jgi:hypothetical protein
MNFFHVWVLRRPIFYPGRAANRVRIYTIRTNSESGNVEMKAEGGRLKHGCRRFYRTGPTLNIFKNLIKI